MGKLQLKEQTWGEFSTLELTIWMLRMYGFIESNCQT
jgi:hypothetical protein